jgi:hypothetical protein
VTEALGATGVALEGTRTINDLNPADWTWLARSRFEASMRLEYFNSQLGAQQGISHNVHFSGFSFGSPFWSAYNAALAIGYVPLTNASSEIVLNDSIGTRTYHASGGANLGYLGVAAQPLNGVAVGARLDLILGNLRHTDFVKFSDPSAASGQFERDYFFHGLRPTLGLQLIGDSLSPGLAGFILGASFSAPVNLVSTRETILTPISSSLDTTIPEHGNGKYPGSLAVGISAHLSGRLRAEADITMSDYTNSFVYSPLETATDPSLTASTRIGIGFERQSNAAGEFGGSYGLDRWALRFGFYYAKLPLAPTGSGGVNEMAVTAGAGIPLGTESMFNIAITGGQRSPVNAATAPKETFLRLGASVSLSERWFVPSRRD